MVRSSSPCLVKLLQVLDEVLRPSSSKEATHHCRWVIVPNRASELLHCLIELPRVQQPLSILGSHVSHVCVINIRLTLCDANGRSKLLCFEQGIYLGSDWLLLQHHGHAPRRESEEAIPSHARQMEHRVRWRRRRAACGTCGTTDVSRKTHS